MLEPNWLKALLAIGLSLGSLQAWGEAPPFIRIVNYSQLSNTCHPGGPAPVLQVNLDVPATAKFSYTISYIDVATTFTYGSPTTYFSISVPIYSSDVQSGPVANTAAPFSIGDLATWYQPNGDPYYAQSVPEHTQLSVTILTYTANDGGDPFTSGNSPSSATLTWDCTTGQVFAFSNTGNSSGAAAAPVVKSNAIEFYNAALDHFFVSAADAEIAALDSGQTPGWKRTGQAFEVFAASADGTSPVCRYYIPPALGDSHFYSASVTECNAVAARFPSFTRESTAVFYAVLPDTSTGACPATTQPVYRLWNRRADSNHRYTVDPAVRSQMIANGYVPEGYGAIGVAMCAPL